MTPSASRAVTRAPDPAPGGPGTPRPNVFRHLSFFRLWDALAPEVQDCPVCFLWKKDMRKRIDDLFYEKATDHELNVTLQRSFGLSSDALALALERGDALGMSLIYAGVARAVAGRLSAGDDELVPGGPCPFRLQAEQSEQAHLRELIDHLPEADVAERYRQSFGLCLQHVRLCLAMIEEPQVRAWLMAQESAKFSRLADELGLFAAKTDYRNEIPFGPEKDAWQRAARKFHQIHPEPVPVKTRRRFGPFRRLFRALQALVAG